VFFELTVVTPVKCKRFASLGGSRRYGTKSL
jgi:hypothetical protein